MRIERTSSIADGLLAIEVGHANFRHHQEYVDEVVVVDDDALPGAMRLLLDRAKLVAEPSGAITLAALLSGAARAMGRTVVVLSGGNVEWEGLREVLGRGE